MSSTGRRIIGEPVLLQDWDNEAEEGAAKYWELFLDLVLVAAASAVADGLKENPTLAGVANFTVLYLLFVNGWMLYTHHITTRFEDGSFLHAMFLLLFILGNAICVVNVTGEIEENLRDLAIGAICQRASVLFITVTVYLCIPRARVFCVRLGILVLTFTVIYFLIFLDIPHDSGIVLLWLVVLLELALEFSLAFSLKLENLIPINIEHTKDRMGILLLVMLGETVVSATIEYRRVAEEHEEDFHDFGTQYFWVLFWALVLVFFYTLLYFALQPPPTFHAFRRSKFHGCLLILSHKFMCGSVLAVGASVKLTVEAVLEQEHMTNFAMRLQGVSVGCSLLLLFVMRVLHYFGVLPRGTEPPYAIFLMNVWWTFFGVASIIPFFVGIFFPIKNPVSSIAFYAIFLFGVCLIESIFTHILEPFILVDALATTNTATMPEHTAEEATESRPLNGKNQSEYESTNVGVLS